jgi:hypothetical protein
MVGHSPTQYPYPVAQRGAFLRTLRSADVRQPDLGSPPSVVSVSGFGANQGGFIRNSGAGADRSQGLVVIHCGAAPAATGTIVLTFPAGIIAAQYVFLCDFATIVAGAPAGNQITLTWNATRVLAGNERLLLAYQWTVST